MAYQPEWRRRKQSYRAETDLAMRSRSPCGGAPCGPKLGELAEYPGWRPLVCCRRPSPLPSLQMQWKFAQNQKTAGLTPLLGSIISLTRKGQRTYPLVARAVCARARSSRTPSLGDILTRDS